MERLSAESETHFVPEEEVLDQSPFGAFPIRDALRVLGLSHVTSGFSEKAFREGPTEMAVVSTVLSAEPRVKRVAQPVGKEILADREEEDGEGREQDLPPRNDAGAPALY